MSFLALILFVCGIALMISNRKASKRNPYVEEHQRKMKDDILYKNYLNWCEENGQLPVDKIGFDKIRGKEKALFEPLERMGIKPYEN